MILAYIKKIYLLPWTLWCAVIFLFFNIIGFVFLYIFLVSGNKKLYHWAHHIPTIIGRLSAFFWGIQVEVSGRENFDASTQYIFVGNHRSMLDAIVSGGFILNPKKFIGKAEILKWPFLGFILRKLYIPVKREDKESRKWSKDQLNIKMKEGYSMVIFSEGRTNNIDEPLLPFKDGAFATSCETHIPIVPFVMFGADRLWHRNVWLIRPGKMYLKFLPTILPLENSDENISKMKNETHQLMFDEYLSLEKSASY